MGKAGVEPKLSRDNQLQVCKWLAEMRGPQEVSNLCQSELAISVTRQNIFLNYLKDKRWKPIIAHLRKNFLDELKGIPIANKAVRLRRLEKVYKEAMTWQTTSRNEHGTIEKIEIGAAISAIRQAQEEVEGKTPLIDQSTHYHVTYQARVNEEGRIITTRVPSKTG